LSNVRSSAQCLTHEKVVGVWHIASDTEELHEIVKLSVDIAAYLWQLARQSHHTPYARNAQGQRTVTGASTDTTLPSSISSSRAL